MSLSGASTKRFKNFVRFFYPGEIIWRIRFGNIDRKTYQKIKTSELFDAEYYAENNPDIVRLKVDPIIHYIKYGGFEHRNPSRYFNSGFYLASNPDVLKSGINPLVHYIMFGVQDKRKPLPEAVEEPDKTSQLTFTGSKLSEDKGKMALQEHEIQLIRYSEFFDGDYYKSTNPDVEKPGVDPAKHFYLHGAREKRNPSTRFNTTYYLELYPDIIESGINPLLHYIKFGRKEGREAIPEIEKPEAVTTQEVRTVQTENVISGNEMNLNIDNEERGIQIIKESNLFDAEYYLSNNYDIKKAGLDPARHYYLHGWKEGRNPGPEFDSDFYLASYNDVKESGINPLIHYLKKGEQENRVYSIEETVENKFGEVFELPDTSNRYTDRSLIKLIAFYLPQYHPIPENDEWWGKGFTEWDNVVTAKPSFEGHYQPHLPVDLGFYDLRVPDVMEEQIKMAKQFGIHGFCFYYYWFDGQRLLEKPLDMFLEHKDWDINFCVCWANENWTRRWDGKEQDILIAQNHSAKDDMAFIADVSEYLRDKRYIRIDGKPLLLIYRPNLLPAIAETAKLWRQWCRSHDIGEIYLAYVQSFEKVNPDEYGFDAAIEFPPNNFNLKRMNSPFATIRKDFKGSIYDWTSMMKMSENYTDPGYKLFRGVCPSWDNTPRRKNESTLLINNDPADFQKWVYNASIETMKRSRKSDERLMFINAWNEWAEGAHLEPDDRNGYAYLNSLKSAIIQVKGDIGLMNYYCQTYLYHINMYKDRIMDINKMFNTKSIDPEYLFLADYYKFIKLIDNKYSQPFKIVNGIPCYAKNNKTIKLRTRDDLFALYEHTIKEETKDIISFVILQYNHSDLTAECVESIKKLNDSRIRIVVVDNNSDLEEQEILRSRYIEDHNVALIFNKSNVGFAAGNNIGYSYAKDKLYSRFIVAINNDIVIDQDNFIEKLYQIFKEWSFSALGPDIQLPDGRHENPYNDFIFDHQKCSEMIEIRKREKETLINTNIVEWYNVRDSSFEEDFIINPLLQGAALIFSPIYIVDNDQAFEELTFLYGEEFVLATNALVNGELLLYSKQLRVIHKEGVTTGEIEGNEKMHHGYDGAILSLQRSISILNDHQQDNGLELQIINSDQIVPSMNQGKKHILFDVLFSQGSFHGGGEYGKTVFNELSNTISNTDDCELWVVANPDLSVDEWIWNRCRRNHIKIIKVEDYVSITKIVNTDVFDVFFTPAIVVYSEGYRYMKTSGQGVNFNCNKTKVIGTLHDIRDYELARDYKLISFFRKSLNCLPESRYPTKDIDGIVKTKKIEANELLKMYRQLCECESIDTLITVSEYSRKVILSTIVDCNQKIKVFYAPMKNRSYPESLDENDIKQFDTSDFALIVNASRMEKNAAAAVKAFDSIFSEPDTSSKVSKGFKVVLTGVENPEDVFCDKIKNPQRFVVFPFLSSEHLEYLYNNTKLLVFVSLSEGFGYPPIEAMSYHKKCLVSRVTSIPEICGEAAFYCDPYDINSIKNGIISSFEKELPVNSIQEQYVKITEKQTSDLKKLVGLLIDKCQSNHNVNNELKQLHI